jgi:hypothetical protein
MLVDELSPVSTVESTLGFVNHLFVHDLLPEGKLPDTVVEETTHHGFA